MSIVQRVLDLLMLSTLISKFLYVLPCNERCRDLSQEMLLRIHVKIGSFPSAKGRKGF